MAPSTKKGKRINYPKTRRRPQDPFAEYPVTAKVCAACRELRPITSFYATGGSRWRERGWTMSKRPYCRGCMMSASNKWRAKNPEKTRLYIARSHMKTTYGISPEIYEILLLQQGGGCAICGTRNPGKRWHGGRFPIDHDASTGKVRGLLCNSCNRGIGQLRHTPKLLRRAAKYLEHPPAAFYLNPVQDGGQLSISDEGQ